MRCGWLTEMSVQRFDFPNSDASDVRRVFQEAAAKALGKEGGPGILSFRSGEVRSRLEHTADPVEAARVGEGGGFAEGDGFHFAVRNGGEDFEIHRGPGSGGILAGFQGEHEIERIARAAEAQRGQGGGLFDGDAGKVRHARISGESVLKKIAAAVVVRQWRQRSRTAVAAA